MNKIHNHNIVIVGGGAGGLELAAGLVKFPKIQVTLVDSSPIHLWKPLLHEAAAGTLNSYEDELSYYNFAARKQFQFCLGTLQHINRNKKEIYLAPVLDEQKNILIPERTISYDVLVIAVGSVSNDFNVKGVREHCLFLDTTEQALLFHQHLLKILMQLPYRSEKNLEIAIVGGGATGVELAAELHYAIRQMASHGMNFQADNVSFSLLEATDRILPALSPRLSELVTQQLEKLGVKINTKEQVKEVTAEGFITQSGKIFPAEIKVWAAGIKAPDFLKNMDGLETNKINQLVVKPTLQTTHDDSIFAIGDCSACYEEKLKKFVPPRAQAAHQQASLLLKSIPYFLKNKALPVYHYKDHGSLISLSHYETIGNLMGRITKSLMIEGKLARFAYRSLYRLHQKALYGSWWVSMLMFANLLTQKIRTRLKLH
jgi:NADH dehydrogenase